MGVAAKTSYTLGSEFKIESAYGTWSTPGTSDGVALQFPDRNLGDAVKYEAAFDGDMGPAQASLGSVQRVAPSGISARAAWPLRLKGAGAAYSLSVVPAGHVLLLSSGLTGTVDTTGAAEKWTYVPTVPGTTFGSHSAEIYQKGRKHQLKGGICSLSIDFANPGPPLATFDTRYFLHADPVDASMASITYALTSITPPLATSVTFVMGSLTTNAVVYSGSFRLTREIDNPRVALTASGGHLGFMPGGYIAELEVMLEDMAETSTPFTGASAFDEYQLWKNATLLSACSIQFGSTQYNRWKIDFGARAQVASFTPAAESPIGKTTLRIVSSVSTPVASDNLTITFN